MAVDKEWRGLSKEIDKKVSVTKREAPVSNVYVSFILTPLFFYYIKEK